MTDLHLRQFCKHLQIDEECQFRKCLAIWRSRRNIVPLVQNSSNLSNDTHKCVEAFGIQSSSKKDVTIVSICNL